MNQIWCLIPTKLTDEVAASLDRAGVSFHVADRSVSAETIARCIIEADGKEFVPITTGECIELCRRWNLIDTADGRGWNTPLTRKDAAVLAVRLRELIEKEANKP